MELIWQWWWWKCLQLLGLMWTMVCLTQGEHLKIEIGSACINGSEKAVQLYCKKGQMVRINRTLFGHSPSGECGYTEGDCFLSENNNNDCSGRQNCTVNLPSGNIGRELPWCKKRRSTYMQVEYACIPDEESVDICQQDLITSQRGYIKSPRYPLNYPTNRDCTIEIRVYPTQRLRLYVLDLQLQVSSQCSDSIYLRDNLHAHTVCSGERTINDELFYSLESKLKITFHSDGVNTTKGFWLYYQAEPHMTPTTSITTTTKRLSTPSPIPRRKEKITTASPSTPTLLSVHTSSSSDSRILQNTRGNVRHKQNGDLSIEAIIGGVLGSLLLILVLLVVLLLIKRRREAKLLQSTSSQQLNPQVASPSGARTNVLTYPWDTSKMEDLEVMF